MLYKISAQVSFFLWGKRMKRLSKVTLDCEADILGVADILSSIP